MSTALIALLSLASLLLPLYVYLRTKGRFANHPPRDQGATNGVTTWAAPFFLLAVLLMTLVTVFSAVVMMGSGVIDRVAVTTEATDQELGNLDTRKATAENAEVIYSVKTTDPAAEVLSTLGYLLPLVGWLSALLCYLPMFRAMHAGKNPLTVEHTRLTSLAAWILLVTLPAAAACDWAVRSIINVGDSSVLNIVDINSFKAGVIALVMAVLLQRGAKAVELEEATV